MLVEPAVDATLQVVGQLTLFKLKQINFVAAYQRRMVSTTRGYAVEKRAERVNVEYRLSCMRSTGSQDGGVRARGCQTASARIATVRP